MSYGPWGNDGPNAVSWFLAIAIIAAYVWAIGTGLGLLAGWLAVTL